MAYNGQWNAEMSFYNHLPVLEDKKYLIYDSIVTKKNIGLCEKALLTLFDIKIYSWIKSTAYTCYMPPWAQDQPSVPHNIFNQ